MTQITLNDELKACVLGAARTVFAEKVRKKEKYTQEEFKNALRNQCKHISITEEELDQIMHLSFEHLYS